MNFELKVKLATLIKYFDTGYNKTSYLKYAIALFGISSLDVKNTLLFGFIYGICCFIFGYFWLRTHMLEAEQEVGNRYNLFVKEVRAKIKGFKQR